MFFVFFTRKVWIHITDYYNINEFISNINMKIYIAYKFHSQNKKTVRGNLTALSNILEELGHKTFVFFRDIQKRGEVTMTPKDIIYTAFQNLKKQDAILAIIINDKKSEWLLLEAGYAKALGKKFFLVIKKWCKWTFIRELADKIIEFEHIDELKKKIRI